MCFTARCSANPGTAAHWPGVCFAVILPGNDVLKQLPTGDSAGRKEFRHRPSGTRTHIWRAPFFLGQHFSREGFHFGQLAVWSPTSLSPNAEITTVIISTLGQTVSGRCESSWKKFSRPSANSEACDCFSSPPASRVKCNTTGRRCSNSGSFRLWFSLWTSDEWDHAGSAPARTRRGAETPPPPPPPFHSPPSKDNKLMNKLSVCQKYRIVKHLLKKMIIIKITWAVMRYLWVKFVKNPTGGKSAADLIRVTSVPLGKTHSRLCSAAALMTTSCGAFLLIKNDCWSNLGMLFEEKGNVLRLSLRLKKKKNRPKNKIKHTAAVHGTFTFASICDGYTLSSKQLTFLCKSTGIFFFFFSN